MAKAKYYKLKDKFGQIEKSLSFDKVCQGIKKGKYNGEEAVAELPDGEWVKLSAVPGFYDVLMERLYASDYQAQTDQKPLPPTKVKDKDRKQKKASPPGQETFQATLQNKNTEHTRKVDSKTKHGGEGTIDQAMLNELFEDDTDRKSDQVSVSKEEAPKPDPLKIPLVEKGRKLKRRLKLHQPLDIFRPKEGEEGHTRVQRKKRRNRRRIVIYSALILALVFLFLDDGSQTSPRVVQEKKIVHETLYLANPSEKKRQAKSYLNEAKQLFSLDLALYYQAAIRLLLQANKLELTPEISTWMAQATARVEAIQSERDAINFKSAKQVVEAGKKIDPHASAYYRADAITLLRENKIEESRKLILNAIDSDPTSPENALMVGEISYVLKDYKKAKTALGTALEDPITRVRAHFLMAKIADGQGDLIRSRQFLLKTMTLNPLYFPAYVLSGDLAAKEKKISSSIRSYKKATQLSALSSPRTASEAFYKLGKLYELSGKKSEAQSSFQLAYYLQPKSQKLKKLLNGKITAKQRALMYRRRVLRKEQFMVRGETALTQNDFETAFRNFQAASAFSEPPMGVLVRMGEVIEKEAIYHEDFLRAKAFYERAILRNPAEPEGYIRLGLLETKQYNFARAHRLLSQAKALAPDDRDALVAMGKHYYKRQDYNRALDEFIEGSQQNDKDGEILYYAGKMRALFSRDPKAAMDLFERSYKSDPLNYRSLAEWLKLKVVTFDKPFAIKFIDNLISVEPNNGKYHWVRGEVHAANKDYDRAIESFHKALDLNNRDSDVRMSLARVYDKQGEKRKAVAEYRLASQLDRRNAEGFHRAAEILIGVGAYKQAEEVLNILVETSPKFPGAQRGLAQVYEATKRPKDAEASMALEVKHNPRNAKFRIELAELLMRHEKFDKAIGHLTKITNLPSLNEAPEYVYDKVRAYLLLSRCYRAKKQYDSAEGAIRLALGIDEGDPTLHKELGYVYVGLQRNKDAVGSFRTYLKRDPAAQDAKKIKSIIDTLVIPE